MRRPTAPLWCRLPAGPGTPSEKGKGRRVGRARSSERNPPMRRASATGAGTSPTLAAGPEGEWGGTPRAPWWPWEAAARAVLAAGGGGFSAERCRSRRSEDLALPTLHLAETRDTRPPYPELHRRGYGASRMTHCPENDSLPPRESAGVRAADHGPVLRCHWPPAGPNRREVRQAPADKPPVACGQRRASAAVRSWYVCGIAAVVAGTVRSTTCRVCRYHAHLRSAMAPGGWGRAMPGPGRGGG